MHGAKNVKKKKKKTTCGISRCTKNALRRIKILSAQKAILVILLFFSGEMAAGLLSPHPPSFV